MAKETKKGGKGKKKRPLPQEGTDIPTNVIKPVDSPAPKQPAGLREEEKAIVKGTFWGLLGNILLKLVSFAYTVIVARLFIPDDVGVFYLALSVVYLVSIFSDLGMNGTFSRYVPFYMGRGDKESAYKLLRLSYVFSGTLSILLGIAMFLASGIIAGIFKAPALDCVMKAISLFFVLNTFFSLNISFLGGLKKVKENALINNLQNALKLFLTVALFLFLGPSAFVIALGFTLSYLVLVLVSFLYVRAGLREAGIKEAGQSLGEQFSLLKEVMPFGIALTMAGAMWATLNYIDKLMLGYLLPVETATATVGVYSIATTLATILLIFPGSVLSIFLPVITELYGKGKRAEMLSVSTTAVRWSIFLTVPLTVVLIVFPEELLQMFYGANYVPGAAVLAIFSAGLFLRYLSFIHGAILNAMRVVRVELYSASFALALNIVLNWFLIPKYGMEGAVVASAISLIVVSLLVLYFSKKIAGFGFPAEGRIPVLGGLFTLLAVFLTKGPVDWLMGLVPNVPLFGEPMLDLIVQKFVKLFILGVLFLFACALYFVFLVLLKAFTKEDRGLMSSMLRRIGVPPVAVGFFEHNLERFF